MKPAGENDVAIIHSEADKKASQRVGQTQAVRPEIVGRAITEIRHEPQVAEALFALLAIHATMKSSGKIVLANPGSAGLMLNSYPNFLSVLDSAFFVEPAVGRLSPASGRAYSPKAIGDWY